jgi:hypothetical protein
MISIFWLALWLQMSAPLDDIKPISEPNICRVVQVYKSGDIEDVVLTCIPNLLADPVDVPAVQVGYYDPPECRETKCIHVKQTCADKSRILEHDENSPPKYWCRKVEF